MTAGRWAEIERLCHAALEREPAARAAFLDEACRGDADLRREVDSLLAQQSQADAFLEVPAADRADVNAAADARAGPLREPLSHGTRLGPYEIDRLIGAGGMGEVYRARDTRLGRTVAVKVLPEDLAADPDRRRRFEHEARAASAINHPCICTLYDIGTSTPSSPESRAPDPESRAPDPVHYLVMEHVEGETLAALIARGPLLLAQVLEYGAQIADALSAAHNHDIVHRDLKPGNVMLAGSGLHRRGAHAVKLLDFGLAKLRRPDSPNPATGAAGLAAASMTTPGQIVGTLPYMAPEQLEGHGTDARTDIWALGVVLHEMVTGARPFQCTSSAGLTAAILEHEPTPLGPLAPPALNRLIRKCLAKNPEARWQSARDVADELTWITSDVVAGNASRAPAAAGTTRRRVWRRVLMAAVVALAAMGAGYLALRSGGAAPPPVPTAPEADFKRLTSQRALELFPSLSPDGQWVVYSAGFGRDVDIYLQSVGGDNPINLTKDSPDADSTPVFSPDGEQIAFHSKRQGGGIFLMGRTGGSVRRLTDAGFNPTWSPDGRQIAFATESVLWSPYSRYFPSSLWVVDVESGEKRRVTQADAVQPCWSPHGHRIAYWDVFRPANNTQRDLWTIAAAGGEPVRVTDDPALDWNPVWSPDGRHLYFASDRGGSMNLWRVAIDEVSGKVLGQPQAVTTPSPFVAHMSFSADGGRMAFSSVVQVSNLQRAPFEPVAGRVVGTPQPVTTGSRSWGVPELSPDGTSIAVGSWHYYGIEDLFVVRSDGSGLRQLTDDPYRDRWPRWSPDGGQLAFQSNRSGHYEVWAIDPDGSRLRQLSDLRSSAISPLWSPDGSRIAFSDSAAGRTLVFDPRKAWDAQTPEVLPPVDEGSGGLSTLGSWSPDGRHIAGGELAGRKPGVLVYHLDSRTYERLTDFGYNPRWLHDSRRLVFESQEGELFLVDSRTRAWHELLSVGGARLFGAEVSRDGRWLYFVRVEEESDIWLATFPEAHSGSDRR